MRTLEGASKVGENSNRGLTMMQTNNNSNTIALPKPQHANNTDDISGGVQDTIYLCNFRVSVDGEWLCLKELQDLDIQDGSGKKTAVEESNDSGQVANYDIANSRFAGDGLSKCERDWVNYYSRDPAAIERSNLVNICKLVVKELLEQSLRFGRMLDSDHLPLQHFFIVLEHVLRHGLRPKKGLLGPKKELWDLLQSVEKYCIEAQDVTASVRDLPTVRTHMGRARAWLRIALMQKKLADYLQALIDHREEALIEYYEPHALMMSDEVVVIMGILIGLNVIDCNLCVKEEDLDSQQGVIDFSLYLRSSSRNSPEDDGNALDGPGGNMTAVLDQKNYIEELNRHLNATVTNLQAKVESLTTTNALMKEDLAIARNSLLALQAENSALRQSIIIQTGQLNHTSNQAITSDASDHRGDSDLDKALTEERKKSQELEKELKLQVSLKAETDMAMKLLEKDIHEKQDTIISLRRQLEDIKQINLEMYKKLQECEDELTQKGEMVSRLQTKASQIGQILQTLEKKYDSKFDQNEIVKDNLSTSEKSGSRRFQTSSHSKKLKNDTGPPSKKLHLKVDPIPPFNANKIRKSPSTTENTSSKDDKDNKVDSKECEASLKHKTELLTKLEKQKEDFASTIALLEKQASDKSTTSKNLSLQISSYEERAARAETDVRLEREWRASLQEKEIKLKDQISNLKDYVKQLTEENKKNDRLKAELEKLRKQWTEAQTTMEELGIQLSISKLRLSELNEKTAAGPENFHQSDAGVWTPDDAVSKCKACCREFKMSRRRHHCRSCGHIFCHNCSDHTAILPHDQQAKPVRVCDSCWETLAGSKN